MEWNPINWISEIELLEQQVVKAINERAIQLMDEMKQRLKKFNLFWVMAGGPLAPHHSTPRK